MSFLGDAGKAISDAGKSVGAVAGLYNPLKKGPTYHAPAVTSPDNVKAPTFDQSAFRNPGQVGGPTAFTGATIHAPADPRQTLINQDPQAQFRAGQQSLAQQLALQASGQGPSLAENQLRQAQHANQAAAFAQLASQRGGPNAGLARQTLQTSAAMGAQTNRDAAAARMQEQMNAQQQLGGVLAQGREGDIGLATSQAQLDQQQALAKYQGDLQIAVQQGQMDQATASQMFEAAVGNARQNAQMQAQAASQFNNLVAQYKQMGVDADKANQYAAMQVQQMQQTGAYNEYQSNAAATAAQQKAISGLLSGSAQAVMQYALPAAAEAAPAALAAL